LKCATNSRPLAAAFALALAGGGCASLPLEHDAWTGKDKWIHFATAAALSAAYTHHRSGRGAGEPPSRASAVGVVLVLGTGKELYDVHTKGGWSYRDMAWNVAGALAGYELAR